MIKKENLFIALLVLSILALCASFFVNETMAADCADSEQVVSLTLTQHVDPYGGGAAAYSYEIKCDPPGECIILEQRKLGKIILITFTDLCGHETTMGYVPEEDD